MAISGHSVQIKAILLVVCMVMITSYAWADDRLAAHTVWLEAWVDGKEGMMAVGEVIRNRAEYRGQTTRKVIMSPKQFSCWNSVKEAEDRLNDMTSSMMRVAREAWAESEFSNLTNGSDHYHAYYVRPGWTKNPLMQKMVRIKRHVFYKWRGRQ